MNKNKNYNGHDDNTVTVKLEFHSYPYYSRLIVRWFLAAAFFGCLIRCWPPTVQPVWGFSSPHHYHYYYYHTPPPPPTTTTTTTTAKQRVGQEQQQQRHNSRKKDSSLFYYKPFLHRRNHPYQQRGEDGPPALLPKQFHVGNVPTSSGLQTSHHRQRSHSVALSLEQKQSNSNEPQQEEDANNNTADTSDSVQEQQPQLLEKPQQESNNNNNSKAIFFNAVSTVWSGFIFLFGATLTCGLILNLLGYGYSLFPPRIAPLEEFRLEQQLLSSSSSSSSVNNGNSPQMVENNYNNGGFSEFFLRNPFTTTLILTGAVLAYESALSFFNDTSDDEKSTKDREDRN